MKRHTPLWRILAAATGVELTVIPGLAVGLGLRGGQSWRLDALNNLAPIWCGLALLGLLLVVVGLERRPVRAVMIAIGVATVVASGGPILWDYAARFDQPRPAIGQKPLKVVTFNASAESYSGEIAATEVMRADPDMFAAQETFIFNDAAALLATRYPYSVTCPKSQTCPLGIWSKRPILRSGYVVKRPGQAGWNDIDLLWAETTAPDGKRVILATTHLLWPLPPGPQAIQRDLLARQMRRLPPGDVILTGDMNSAPWTFALRRLDRNLAPLSRRTRALITWPAYIPRLFARVGVPFLAIDHVYAGPAFATSSVRRLNPAASDHFPVEVVLTRSAPAK